jgi:predicted porin
MGERCFGCVTHINLTIEIFRETKKMQKKIIVLAIAGALASIVAGSALAADVTIYGNADVGMVSQSGSGGNVNTNGTLTTVDSGVSGDSFLGFKGTEDVGNGITALFDLKGLVNYTSQSNSSSANGLSGGGLSSGHAMAGVTGSFGTAVIGRLDGARYSFAGKYNAFGLGSVGQFANLQVHQTRADNAVAYISPTMSGFSVLAAYTTNLTGFTKTLATAQCFTAGCKPVGSVMDTNTHLFAIAPQYNNGPISVTYDYEKAETGGTPNSGIAINVLAGSYDLGVAKVLAYWESIKHDKATAWDTKSWTLGATAPFGGNLLGKVSYGKVNDANNGTGVGMGNLSKVSLGLDYTLTKNTKVYVDYATISNGTGGRGTMAYSGYTNSLESGQNGFGTKGFDVGIAKSF